MEAGPEVGFEPSLEAIITVPNHAFKKRIDQSYNDPGSQKLRPEFRALGNSTRDDSRNGRRKGQQEEEFNQRQALLTIRFVAAIATNSGGRGQKVHAIGDRIADKEISQSRHTEIRKNFDHGIDLVFLAHRTHFQKSKASMHSKHQNGAHKNKKDVTAYCAVFH